MLSEQSDPVELYHKLIAVTMDFGKALDACAEYRNQLAASKAEVERLKVINADMRNFLSKAIHNEGFNEDQALRRLMSLFTANLQNLNHNKK